MRWLSQSGRATEKKNKAQGFLTGQRNTTGCRQKYEHTPLYTFELLTCVCSVKQVHLWITELGFNVKEINGGWHEIFGGQTICNDTDEMKACVYSADILRLAPNSLKKKSTTLTM